MTSSAESTARAAAAHILVIPYPGQGHLIPLLELTHHLLTRGITITVLVTPKNLPFLEPLLSSHPSTALSTLVLPLPPHPSLPAGGENTNDLPPNSIFAILDAFSHLQDPIIQWFSSHPSPPSAIVADMFLTWTHQLASQLGIKSLHFSPSGAFAFSVLHSLRANFPPLPTTDNGEIDENAVVSVDDIPSRPEFSFRQLSPAYMVFVSREPMFQSLVEVFTDSSARWGLVFNTFTGLELAYLDYMKSFVGHDRVWAVGPLFLPENEVGIEPKLRKGSSPVEERVVSWLDTCQDGEVVYVSFGSQYILTREQIDVLALALERSGIRFVWKFKEPSREHVDGQIFGDLPHGLEDRVVGRGLLIREWAPQVTILKHRAVGSFLTHCGWNSVLEGLDAGTVLLTWPLEADQFFNAKLLIDLLKVGVKVGHGMKMLPNPDELAQILTKAVSGAYKGEKSRIMELRKEAFQATSKEGSSSKALSLLVQHLNELPKPDPNVNRECERRIEKQDTTSVSTVSASVDTNSTCAVISAKNDIQQAAERNGVDDGMLKTAINEAA